MNNGRVQFPIETLYPSTPRLKLDKVFARSRASGSTWSVQSWMLLLKSSRHSAMPSCWHSLIQWSEESGSPHRVQSSASARKAGSRTPFALLFPTVQCFSCNMRSQRLRLPRDELAIRMQVAAYGMVVKLDHLGGSCRSARATSLCTRAAMRRVYATWGFRSARIRWPVRSCTHDHEAAGIRDQNRSARASGCATGGRSKYAGGVSGTGRAEWAARKLPMRTKSQSAVKIDLPGLGAWKSDRRGVRLRPSRIRR